MAQHEPRTDGGHGGVAIRPAASLLVIRQSVGELEVLLLKRADSMRFLPGFLSFPGGSLDEEDYLLADSATGAPLASALPEDVAFAVAAIRECAEETGLVLSLTNGTVETAAPSPGSRPEVSSPVALSPELQASLLTHQTGFGEVLQRQQWRVDASRLRFVGRWITPPNMPARFDTRFFLTVIQPGAVAIRVNPAESQWGRWCTPRSVLTGIDEGRAKAAPPTVAMLQALATFAGAEDCFRHLNVPGPKPEELIELAEKLNRL